jgi:hypothetical protein
LLVLHHILLVLVHMKKKHVEIHSNFLFLSI